MRQISSTRSLTTVDRFRRSRSISRTPPAVRTLKKATPTSQASTSHGRASGEGTTLEVPKRAEPLTADFSTTGPLTLGLATAASGDDFAASAPPESFCKKKTKVASGDSSISSNAAADTTYRTEARRQRDIIPAAMAASAVPCQRKCSSAHPTECIALRETQFVRLVVIVVLIGGSFRSRPANGAVR